MKRITSLILTILAVGCTNEVTQSDVQSGGGDLIEASISFKTKAGSDAPVINSFRLVAFDNEGSCAFNTKYETFEIKNEPDGYKCSIQEPCVLAASNSNVYTVYAILNEEGYVLEGGNTSLADALDGIAVNTRSQLEFNGIYGSRVKYSALPAGTTEPAFLISANKVVTIPDGSSINPHPVDLKTDAEVSQRPMAQITVESITSAPETGSYTSSNVPKILIKSMSIENVPSSTVWNTSQGTVGAERISIPLGEANASGYYDREWDGTITQTFDNIDVIRATSSDKEYWSRYHTYVEKIDGKSNVVYKNTNAYWTFNPVETTDVIAVGNITSEGPADYDKEANARTAAKEIAKDKNSVTPFIADLDAMFADPANIVSAVYSLDPTGSYSFGTATLSDNEYWSIDLSGNSYYVPENIQTDGADNATFILVRAAIYEPSSASMLSDAALGSVTEPFSISSASYTLDGTAFNFTQNNNGEYQVTDDQKNLLYNKATVVSSSTTNKYNVYLTGFGQIAYGNFSDVTLEGSGEDIDWEPTGKVYDFIIPVNNNINNDGDYSVRRNTKYNITLHVTEQAYSAIDSAPTKGACPSPCFGITASVRREQMNDHE